MARPLICISSLRNYGVDSGSTRPGSRSGRRTGVAGDLTNYGKPPEMEELLNSLVRLRLPIVAVLGNHDYECGFGGRTDTHDDAGRDQASGRHRVRTRWRRLCRHQGFSRRLWRSALTSFGEPEVKAFVQAAIDEALKLERAMAQLRTAKRVGGASLRADRRHHSRERSPEIYPIWVAPVLRKSSTGTARTSCMAMRTMAHPMAKRPLEFPFTTSLSLSFRDKSRR